MVNAKFIISLPTITTVGSLNKLTEAFWFSFYKIETNPTSKTNSNRKFYKKMGLPQQFKIYFFFFVLEKFDAKT